MWTPIGADISRSFVAQQVLGRTPRLHAVKGASSTALTSFARSVSVQSSRPRVLRDDYLQRKTEKNCTRHR